MIVFYNSDIYFIIFIYNFTTRANYTRQHKYTLWPYHQHILVSAQTTQKVQFKKMNTKIRYRISVFQKARICFWRDRVTYSPFSLRLFLANHDSSTSLVLLLVSDFIKRGPIYIYCRFLISLTPYAEYERVSWGLQKEDDD